MIVILDLVEGAKLHSEPFSLLGHAAGRRNNIQILHGGHLHMRHYLVEIRERADLLVPLNHALEFAFGVQNGRAP